MTDNTVHWKLPSGNIYNYHPHPIGTTFLDVPGNYVFAKQNADGSFAAVYVGETKSLKNRHDGSHEKLPCAKKNGATHILARINKDGESARIKEQNELIAFLKPACNVQGK
jgi:hypothetical protein